MPEKPERASKTPFLKDFPGHAPEFVEFFATFLGVRTRALLAGINATQNFS
jgi:hypothetical protein